MLMDADWSEITRLAVPTPGPPGPLPSPPASAVAFDDLQELLWLGTDHGRLISYYGTQLQKYTSIKAHLQEGPIRQILVCERGVLSISSRSIHLINRRGLTQWHLTDSTMVELRCMAFTAISNLLMVAGCQNTFYIIDIEKGCIVSTHSSEARYILIKRCRHICAATDDGFMHIIDASTYLVIQSWKAHSSRVSDMDARHDYLVTCGVSVRPQMNTTMIDPFVSVYDLKALKPLPPIPFHTGAAHVRLHPKLSATGFVASNTGQMQVVDLLNPVNVMLRQVSVQYMVEMELASSGDALIVNDLSGMIYLWGSPTKVKFNNMSKETEFGQPPPRNLPSVDWQDQPLNTIGMPYYNETKL